MTEGSNTRGEALTLIAGLPGLSSLPDGKPLVDMDSRVQNYGSARSRRCIMCLERAPGSGFPKRCTMVKLYNSWSKMRSAVWNPIRFFDPYLSLMQGNRVSMGLGSTILMAHVVVSGRFYTYYPDLSDIATARGRLHHRERDNTKNHTDAAAIINKSPPGFQFRRSFLGKDCLFIDLIECLVSWQPR